MKYYRTILGAAIVVVGLVLPARAGLIVSIGSTTMLRNGTGTVDVMMTGVDKLQMCNLNFMITSAQSGLVTFTRPAGTEPFTDSPDYVFKGDSVVWTNPSRFFEAPAGDPLGSTINGADATSSGNNVVINDPAIPKLLATLYLTASPTAMAGQWAAITLDPTSSFTYFDENLPGDVNYEYSSLGGVVTIGAAVPEPGSIGLFLGILGVGSVVTRYRARRRRKSQTTDNVLPLESASL